MSCSSHTGGESIPSSTTKYLGPTVTSRRVKQKEGTEMNDFTFNPINSNSEERTSSMSDYSTSTTPDETQYQENTPIITPEIVDAGSELNISEADDENNPIVLLSEKLPATVEHPLSDDECAFTREEAEALTQDLQLKYRDTIEAHYNLIAGVRKAHDGHIWLALGYPQGAAAGRPIARTTSRLPQSN